MYIRLSVRHDDVPSRLFPREELRSFCGLFGQQATVRCTFTLLMMLVLIQVLLSVGVRDGMASTVSVVLSPSQEGVSVGANAEPFVLVSDGPHRDGLQHRQVEPSWCVMPVYAPLAVCERADKSLHRCVSCGCGGQQRHVLPGGPVLGRLGVP